MNLKNQINLLGSQIKHGLVVGIVASLIFSAVYAFTTPLPQVTTGDPLTAQLWNDMTDAVNNEYLTDGTEVLTNKTWNGNSVYRRVFSADPNDGRILLGTIPNVTPIGNWSQVTGGVEYWYGEVSHYNLALSYVYSPSEGSLKVFQVGWPDSTFSETTFVFEYIKN